MGLIGTIGSMQTNLDERMPELDPTQPPKPTVTKKVLAWLSLVVITTTSSVLFIWLHEDLMYFFRSREPTDMGEAYNLDQNNLPLNAFVRVAGIARDMCIRADQFWHPVKYLYLLGSPLGARIVIEAPSQKDEPCLGALEQAFVGRFLHIDPEGKYKHVIEHYRNRFAKAPRSGRLYLLKDGDDPSSNWMIPGLFLILLGVWIANIRSIRRTWK